MDNIEKTIAEICHVPKVTKAEKEALVEAIRETLQKSTYKGILKCELTKDAVKRIVRGTSDDRLEIVNEIAELLKLNLLQFTHQLEKHLPKALSVICRD